MAESAETVGGACSSVAESTASCAEEATAGRGVHCIFEGKVYSKCYFFFVFPPCDPPEEPLGAVFKEA